MPLRHFTRIIGFKRNRLPNKYVPAADTVQSGYKTSTFKEIKFYDELFLIFWATGWFQVFSINPDEVWSLLPVISTTMSFALPIAGRPNPAYWNFAISFRIWESPPLLPLFPHWLPNSLLWISELLSFNNLHKSFINGLFLPSGYGCVEIALSHNRSALKTPTFHLSLWYVTPKFCAHFIIRDCAAAAITDDGIQPSLPM